MEKITEEALNKALEILNLTSTKQEVEEPVEELSEIQKAEQEVAQAQARLDALKNKTPETSQELSKAFKDQFTALGHLIQSKDEEIAELKKANEEISAGFNEIKKFNEDLAQRLGMVERQPLERKSVSSKPVERFEKGGEAAEEGGKTVYSISKAKDRRELASFMANEAIEKARETGGKVEAQEFYKAAQCVELGSLGDTPAHAEKIQRLLASKYNILVTGYSK